MKYDIVLKPSLKKNWIHFDLELHNEKGKEIGRHYSSSYAGNVDYPAFRPDCERDIEEVFNDNKIDLDSLKSRFSFFYVLEEVDNLWENINSVKIRNPLYYCLKSKVVWQKKEDDENPIYTDKLLQVKTYNKYENEGNKIVVTECQRDRMEDYLELGEFVEIKREHIKEYEEIKQKLVDGEIHYNKYHNEIGSIFLRMIYDIEKRY